MNAFSNAAFLRAAGRPRDLPPVAGPELAFAGRSNVGKSSAINALCGRRALARTSKTPGRTQTINFYELSGGARLADLPGYGYARVAKTLRDDWARLVEAYLQSRPTLAAVVLVMDARHPLTALDQQLMAWVKGQRLLVLLSKADKLGRADQSRVLAQVNRALAQRPGPARAALFSSVSGLGVEDCRGLLEGWLQPPAGGENKRPPVKGI
ncbi:MAG: ribosome biogenesis GTP-binding protein YihA/YsxC [Clostridia bacterium]